MFSCFGKFVKYEELHEDALVPDTKLVVRDNDGRETTGKILFGTLGPTDFQIYLNEKKNNIMTINKLDNTYRILENGPPIKIYGMRGGKTRKKNKRNKSTRRKLIRRRSECKKCKK